MMLNTRVLAITLFWFFPAIGAADKLIAHPQVAIETTEGRIVVELDTRRAPLTVERFVTLVRKGYYDGLIFHRVDRDFVIQAGGYNAKYESPESEDGIPNESGNGLSNTRGTIALARTADPHSGNAQFFINLRDNTMLDPRPDRWGYAVFGEVIEGMDVVDAINQLPTGPAGPFAKDAPQFPIIIEKATVTTD